MPVRKISFIEAASEFHMLQRFTIARVGTVLLSTILRAKGYEVRTFIEDISRPDWEYIENSDVVCISTLTTTAVRAYSIGRMLRSKGVCVIMGGAHPTFMPDEALGFSDYVIRGEGDYSLPKLIGYLDTGRPELPDIEGLSYRDGNGAIVHNPAGRLLDEAEIEEQPIPDFSLVHNWKRSIIYPISTSRGCPFDCRFCSVIRMFGRKYRFKSVGAAMKELRHAHSVSKATKFFVDDNFTANKQRTKELLRAMIAEGLTSTWAAQCRVDIAADPELLRLMADSGCHTIYIGFESINPLTLKAYNKKQQLDDIIRCVRTVKDYGLHIHGMFVLGADTDDVDTIKQTADFAMKMRLDTTQIMALTPLPGTPLFEEMKESDRLLHTDWSKYNLQHVVFKPSQMSPETLQLEILKGMMRFYSWRYILGRLVKLDFHYTAIGYYGRYVSSKSLKEARKYLGTIADKPQNRGVFAGSHFEQRH